MTRIAKHSTMSRALLCSTPNVRRKHDFGSFDADGHTIFFKIDYFDKDLKYHSPDPADPTVTERLITIMLAEEY